MSQAAHTTHSPPPTDPWVPLLELRAAFAGSRKRVERWWAGLEGTARRRDGRRLLAHRDWARLPDGRCVSAFLAAAHADLAGLLVPPGFAERAAPSDVARFLALTEARAAVEALRRERGVSRTVATNQVCAERAAWLRAVQVTVWGRPHTVRLPATPSALRLALARVTPGHPRFDGGLDRRGRRTAAGGAPDPRFAESLVSQLHAGTSIRFSAAYRFAA
ncbi:MAG TPA: hypothetical protein PKC49_11320, partial [Phycisphaerae bacterium]|nr:hypothetical protein [Phycisphaerae bacterium]